MNYEWPTICDNNARLISDVDLFTLTSVGGVTMRLCGVQGGDEDSRRRRICCWEVIHIAVILGCLAIAE